MTMPDNVRNGWSLVVEHGATLLRVLLAAVLVGIWVEWRALAAKDVALTMSVTALTQDVAAVRAVQSQSADHITRIVALETNEKATAESLRRIERKLDELIDGLVRDRTRPN